ncbi:MAG: glycosyltransferase family 4 protein [Alcanivoracaceae bacterium]|jgi:Fuc2NAc and GlcNAc transferase|nr:glycosyltransferase family 4 protein [Alcanivoracaceae bacterium]
MTLALIMLAVLAATVVATGWVRQVAIKRQIIDTPNARSSHALPTPRGGGVGFVLVLLLALPALWLGQWLGTTVVLAFVPAGLAVALLGFLDDLGHVPARWRLLGHFAAAGWLLWMLGGLPPLPLWGASVDLGLVGHGLALLFLVWSLNLFNFMDGIDGIAAGEAVTVCLAGALLLLMVLPGAMLLPLLFAAAVAGFLVWNAPPARIFMGDAGSGFLGLSLAGLMVWGAHLSATLFYGWLIVYGVFVVDATLTLLRRVLRGERFYEAHRSHAYQYASRRLGSHAPVTLAVMAINLIWLLPWALAVVVGWLNPLLGLALAWLPLVVLAWWLKAGDATGQGAHA